MKSYYILPLALMIVISNNLFSQRSDKFDANFKQVKAELTDWDAVRGEWLANSLTAMSENAPIPDRNFPENFTPAQMMSIVPVQTVQNINAIARSHERDELDRDTWAMISSQTNRRNCQKTTGRSYGDPHLESFDGAKYSFQTVGEFVMAKSGNGQVEVQVRQKAQKDDFSLNTAVAANVNGDRVCIYASDLPDGDHSTPVRVNGMPVFVSETPYFLAHGGTIRQSGGKYVVDWASGEALSVDIRNRAVMSFMNVYLEVYPCVNGGYFGLLGNANGSMRDDFNTSRGVAPIGILGNTGGNNSSEYFEKQRAAFLAKEFAEDNRITQASSLFDYSIGKSTFSFTDRSYPRVHRSIDDLSKDRRDLARRNCESRGITGGDLNGCIYDNGFLEIEPTERYTVKDPTEGVIVRQVDGRVPNVNPTTPTVRSTSADEIQGKTKATTIFDAPNAEPMIKNDPVRSSTTIEKEVSKPDPIRSNPTIYKEPTIFKEPTREPKVSIPTPKPRTTPSKPKIPTSKPPSSTPRPTIPKSGGRTIGG